MKPSPAQIAKAVSERRETSTQWATDATVNFLLTHVAMLAEHVAAAHHEQSDAEQVEILRAERDALKELIKMRDQQLSGAGKALDDMRTQERIQRERADQWKAKWSAHERVMSAMCDSLADATRRLQTIFGDDLTWDELLNAAVEELENRAEEA